MQHFQLVISLGFADAVMKELIAEFINCTIISEEAVSCNGSVYNLPEKRLTYHDKGFWIYIGIYTALVVCAGEKLDPTNSDWLKRTRSQSHSQ